MLILCRKEQILNYRSYLQVEEKTKQGNLEIEQASQILFSTEPTDSDVQNKLIYFNPVAVFSWQQMNGFNYHYVAFIVHDKHGTIQKQKLKPVKLAVLIKASDKCSKN